MHDPSVPAATGGRITTVMEEIRTRISGRRLLPGARLPSVRAFAGAMGVSPSTVVEAYERLAAEGLIRSRPGSGFYVSASPAPLSLAAVGPRRERDVDPLWISRQALEAGDTLLKPGCGWLPPDWMPEEAIRKALRRLARDNSAMLSDYDTPAGHPELRALLARRLQERGIPASADQIVLTESGTQAIDLVCRLLIEPGDTVMLDDPCYFNFHALLRAHRARIIGVPMTPDGPDPDAFERLAEAEKPRLYITNSGIHNPTGAVLSPLHAHRILRAAAAARITIIEDDIFADLEETAAPRLAAFDGLDRVVEIGSFSKTISASFRCGFMAAKPEWADALTDLKIATGFASGRLSAGLVLELLKDGGYRRHLEQLRLRLHGTRDRVLARLDRLGLEPWLRPRAGLFVWCRLPGDADAAAVARACLADGVVLAPGSAFSPSEGANACLRFNVAQCDDERIWLSLEKALVHFRVDRNRNCNL